MMLVSLSALILVYLGMNRTSEELEEKLLSINETIGKNEEAFAEESLLSQAEATIRSVGTLQMRIIYRHLSMINNAVEKNEEVDITFKDGARIGVNALNSLSKVILK